VAYSCEYGNGPLSSIKYSKFLGGRTNIGFSRRTHLHVVSWLVGLVS
jgi:hypothetical protein